MTAAKTFEPKLLINGKLVDASDKKTFPLYNPATLEKVADVPEASEEDTNAAVAAAKAAFPSWSVLSPRERGKCFKKLAALITEAIPELSRLEAISMGKPVSGFFDGGAAAREFEYYSEAYYSPQGTTSLHTPGFVNMTIRQPYGVVAAIIPWNVPLLFFAQKAAPALIAGNTVVLKSSEKAPLTSARVAVMVQEAGFPPGVFNILSGHGSPCGAVLSSHMDVRALSFTGSGRTGRLIQIAAAKSNLKKVLLELGGKSPAVIFDDADLEQAVEHTQASIQMNSGQICMANSRIYVQETVADKFLAAFKEKFAAVKAGNPTDQDINHGPQADEVQYKNVINYIEEGKKSATLVLGGNGKIQSLNGHFVDPTIFTNAAEDSKIMKEEIFGPVVIINTFKTEDEVIEKANDTEYGLYASVFTKNVDRAMRLAKALEAGTVGINCTSPMVAEDMPFGGYKASGQGREGSLQSIDNFLEIKTVYLKIQDAQS